MIHRFFFKIFSLFITACFALSTISFQFASSNVCDIDDYFFSVDLEDKTLTKNQNIYFLINDFEFLPTFFRKSITFPSLSLSTSFLFTEPTCRSPPNPNLF